MKNAPPSRAPIRFGVFELDPETGELRKQGLKVRLQEQPFQILQILLEHPGKVVTREELRQRIWPSDTFVDFNQGLYNATKKLREALGDSADTPRYIETLSRRGYRFIGTVSGNGALRTAPEVPQEAATIETHKPTRHNLRMGIVLGTGAVMLLVAVLVLMPSSWRSRLLGKTVAPEIRSIAVLPLQNLSGDPAQEYFADGMTDALITDLAQIGSLKVISRTSSMQYKGTGKKSLPEIARELNVDGIVEGTVQRSGDRVRITAQLIHGPSDKHLWANSYERETRDVFALERDVADAIAQQVQAKLEAPSREGPTQRRPVDPEVLDAYVRGSYYLDRRGRGAGDDERKEARKYFQRAIDLDPNFAPAYVGLAEAHDVLSWSEPEDLVTTRRLAEKAVELDPTSSEARLDLAQSKDWDWPGVEVDTRRALALNPNNADAHDTLGRVLDITGRLDEGWKEFQIAQELDPNHDHLAEPLYQRGHYDEAIEILQRFVKRDPLDGYNYWALAMNHAQKRMFKEFTTEMGQACALYGVPEVSGRLQYAYNHFGDQGVPRAWAELLEHYATARVVYFPGALAQVYAALGDKDRAFYWLEQYRLHHDVATADPTIFFKTDPWFTPLRSDPRFSDFLRRAGLPP